MKEIQKALLELTQALGVDLVCRELQPNSGFDFEVRFQGLQPPYGLSVAIGEDYLSWWLELRLDEYAIPLLRMFRDSYQANLETFEGFVDVASSRQAQFRVEVNGSLISLADAGADWSSFAISASSPYLSVPQRGEVLESLLFDVLGTVLVLLESHLVFTEQEDVEEPGEFEGEKTRVLMNKYERSRINRKRCLDYFGFSCHGCGLDMAKIYGPIGNQVIHVHHLVPVSAMGRSYRLNPLTDLVPLCPNCHNVVHRTNPPQSISQLRLATGYEAESI